MRLIIYFFVTLIIFNHNSYSLFNSNNESYYQTLRSNWTKIFPDGNRNAAGPKFFKFLIDQNYNIDDFLIYNKLYCPVSGSLVHPQSKPEFLYIKNSKNENICGYYYRCCWPCSCDLMKYAKTEKINLKFNDSQDDIHVLTIENPCQKKDFPREINRDYFCKGDKLDEKQVFVHNNKLIIGMLHDAKICKEDDIKKINSHKITGKKCSERNNTPIEELNSGMGDIFIKLAN